MPCKKRILVLMEVPLAIYDGAVNVILENRFSFTRNVSDMFLYTEFPDLSPEEKDVLRAVVTHELDETWS